MMLSLEETEAKSEFCGIGCGGQREGETSRLEQSLATDDCPKCGGGDHLSVPRLSDAKKKVLEYGKKGQEE